MTADIYEEIKLQFKRDKLAEEVDNNFRKRDGCVKR